MSDRLFVGDGEMRAHCRALDWSTTALGPVGQWPLSLRTIVATVLAARHPMFLWWGSELVQVYNDAYRPSLGERGRHPRALGMRGRECWTEIWDVISPQIEQVLGGGPATWHEEELIPIERNGHLEDVWWTYSYNPAFDDDGTVNGVLVVCQEVTGHVRARAHIEAARAEAEASRERISGLHAFTALLAGSSTDQEIVDAIVDHATEAMGAAAIVIARVSADGTHLELVRATDMSDEVYEAWKQFPVDANAPLAEAVRTREPLFIESREEWRTRYPALESLLDATGHHANIVTPLVVDGRVFGVLGAAFSAPRTFTAEDRAASVALARQCAQALERARLFEAERVARAAAESANRAKSDFLAVMSHELRTPLNAIDGYAELMELGIRGAVTDEQRQDLGRIRKSQRHLLGLINGVLNYSRVEARAVQYALEDVIIGEVIATCEALVAPQVRAKRLTLHAPACEPSLVARGDSEKVQQIILNLLSNAVKFTEPGGRIELACSAPGGEVRVAVSDTGRGIRADQLTRVFEPFVQVDANLTRTQEGVGLGLAISRDLARGMGGDLTAESMPGRGSVFTLTLPAA